MPPKVNVGAEENEPASGTGEALALAAASTGLSGSETAAEVGSVAVTCAVASRAGAAALAAPAEVVSGNPTLDGDTTCGLPDVSSGLGPAAAAGASLGAAIGSADVAIDSKTEGTGSADSAARVIGLEAETAMLVCGVCFCAGMTVTRGATGGTGREGTTRGVTSTGFAAAVAEGAGLAAALAADAAGFAASFLRSSPRATRNVPFACSTLIGLVRTRLAPMRKALATPACPSTTATAKAD